MKHTLVVGRADEYTFRLAHDIRRLGRDAICAHTCAKAMNLLTGTAEFSTIFCHLDVEHPGDGLGFLNLARRKAEVENKETRLILVADRGDVLRVTEPAFKIPVDTILEQPVTFDKIAELSTE